MQLLRVCNASCYANASWSRNTCFSVLCLHQCVCVSVWLHVSQSATWTCINYESVILVPHRHHFPFASYYDRHIREARREFEREQNSHSLSFSQPKMHTTLMHQGHGRSCDSEQGFSDGCSVCFTEAESQGVC